MSHLAELEAQVEEVLRRADVTSAFMVEILEEHSPGHPFGKSKWLHMQAMAANTAEFAQQFDFDAVEEQLFKVCRRLHDMGRHQMAILKLDGLDPEVEHGALSRDIILQHKLLEPLPEVHHEPILLAVVFHSELEVKLESGSLAYRLCYALRDCDKQEGLTAEKFLKPRGILEQMRMFNFPHRVKDGLLHELPPISLGSSLEETIARYLNGTLRADETPLWLVGNMQITAKHLNFAGPLARYAVVRIMSDGIPQHMIDQFLQKRQLLRQDVKYSWAAYLLWLLAWLFDVQHPKFRANLKIHPQVIAKLDYVKRHVTPEIAAQIQQTFDSI